MAERASGAKSRAKLNHAGHTEQRAALEESLISLCVWIACVNTGFVNLPDQEEKYEEMMVKSKDMVLLFLFSVLYRNLNHLILYLYLIRI